MDAIFFLLPAALFLSGGFALLFLHASGDGQFDDLDDPTHRILMDD